MKHNHPGLLSTIFRRVVNTGWRLRRKLPVIMTWDSLVEFERQSIQQGIAWGRQQYQSQAVAEFAKKKADDIRAMRMDMEVTSQCIEIIERTGFGKKGGDA